MPRKQSLQGSPDKLRKKCCPSSGPAASPARRCIAFRARDVLCKSLALCISGRDFARCVRAKFYVSIKQKLKRNGTKYPKRAVNLFNEKQK